MTRFDHSSQDLPPDHEADVSDLGTDALDARLNEIAQRQGRATAWFRRGPKRGSRIEKAAVGPAFAEAYHARLDEEEASEPGASQLDPTLWEQIMATTTIQQSQLRDLNARTDQFVMEEPAMPPARFIFSPQLKASDCSDEISGRSGIVPNRRVMGRLAVAVLFLLGVGLAALALWGPMWRGLGADPPRQLAAMLGLDEDEPDPQVPASSSTMSITVRPGDYEAGRVKVGLWEIMLPGGAMISSGPADEPFSFDVSRGTVLVSGLEPELTIDEGNSAGDLPEGAQIHNPGPDAVELLVLVPITSDAAFPLLIDLGIPEGVAAATAENTLQSSAKPLLLSSVELDDSEAYQYRVLVTDNFLVPGMRLVELERNGPPNAVLQAVTVRDGRVEVMPQETGFTPEAADALTSGDTLYCKETGVWDSDLQVTSSNGASVLGLMTMPVAENHTLDQSVPSIAPFWGEWTVPASGEIALTIRKLVIEPGGSYSLPSDAGVIYHVGSGTVSVHNGDTRQTMPVSSVGTVAQVPGTVLTLTNDGSLPAEIHQAMVSDGTRDFAYSREFLERVAIESLVETTTTLPTGDVSLMLEVREFTGINDGGSLGDGPSLVLITSVSGEISVHRNGGDAQLVSNRGDSPVIPALGESNRIAPGGYLVAQPGAGWSVTGAPGAPSTGLVLSVSPIFEPIATPIASPVSIPTETGQITGQAEACDIAPLTMEHVGELASTPSATTSPLERSLRHDESGVKDSATTNEIMALLQAYSDCNATGDYPRIYAFYSDQAIRESEVIQDLVESDHNVGEMPPFTTAVEDIVLFADGRAGAKTVIGHEAAYLTFVYEDGRWKIDVWDDSP